MVVGFNGDVYVALGLSSKIKKISASTGLVSTSAGKIGGSTLDGVLATSAGLNYPLYITSGSNGDLYINEGNFIRRIVSSSGRIYRYTNGTIITVAGNGTYGYSGDGGLAIAAKLYVPCGLTVSPITGEVYFVDGGNYRVRKFTPGGNITLVAGCGMPVYKGDGGLAVNACLNSATDLILPNGEILILEPNRLRKIDGIF